MEGVTYLDYNASTPCDPRVLEAMLPWLGQRGANPASNGHRPGLEARTALEDARAAIARALGASSPTEITFTSGATEANNLALKGLAATAGRRRHLVTQATEHPSVLETLRFMATSGFELTVVGVSNNGQVRLDELATALRDHTLVLSLMLANNETGTIQPIAEAIELARARGVLFHCDAVQGLGKIPLDLRALGVDLLSVSGHKACGPKGVGALYVRRRRPPLRLEPLLHGGRQESGLRSGTVNLPGCVGLARAAELAVAELPIESQRVATLRDRLERRLLDSVDGCAVNGFVGHRLPGTSNVSFAGIEANALLTALHDIAASSGSACSSSHPEPSPVLTAMGCDRARAHAAVRFSMGRFTTAEEVDHAVRRVAEEVGRLRHVNRSMRR